MKRLLLLSLLVPALAAAGVPDEDMILDRTMDAPVSYTHLVSPRSGPTEMIFTGTPVCRSMNST